MFQSAIRRSDHEQSVPFSVVTKNGKHRSRERSRNIQQPAGEGDYNLDRASFPMAEPKEAVSSWRDRSHNKRYRFGIL